MAQDIQYTMGQVRYASTSSYMTSMTNSFSAGEVYNNFLTTTAEGVANNQRYTDILIKRSASGNETFNPSETYYLHLDIPQHVNYDCVYQIKLIEIENLVNNTLQTPPYQMLRYFSVEKASGKGTVSRVILYPTTNSTGIPYNGNGTNYTPQVAIATEVAQEENITTNNKVYYVRTNEKYYLRKNDINYEINNKNDLILEHSWLNQTSTQDAKKSLDIIFKPDSSNYNAILIEMVRNSLDSDIYQIKSGQSSIDSYGRKIDVDQFSFRLYSLIDFLSETGAIGKVYQHEIWNIGVYGRPGLLMAINGEEIKIAQSGFYELNNFEINSLCIAAESDLDRFTLDYQYGVVNS